MQKNLIQQINHTNAQKNLQLSATQTMDYTPAQGVRSLHPSVLTQIKQKKVCSPYTHAGVTLSPNQIHSKSQLKQQQNSAVTQNNHIVISHISLEKEL